MLEEVKVVAEAIGKTSELVREIYGDLAKPGVVQLGRAIGGIVGLGNTVLWPIHWANEYARIALEANLERTRRRMSEIPLDDVVPIRSEIGVPLLDRFTSVLDPTLGDLYAGLLASAARSTGPSVHPVYISIVAGITPDEAVLLRHMLNRTVSYQVRKQRVQSTGESIWVVKTDGAREVLSRPDDLDLYLMNLQALGLVSGVDAKILAEEFPPFAKVKGEVYTVEASHGFSASLTKLGRQFLAACCVQPADVAAESTGGGG